MSPYEFINQISIDTPSTLIVLVGPPCSGKSQIARLMNQEYGFIHYKAGEEYKKRNDEYMYNHPDIKYYDSSVKDALYSDINSDIARLLDQGNTVVYDACNAYPKWRSKLLREIGDSAEYKVCLVTTSPLSACLEKNLTLGEDALAEDTIVRMYQSIQRHAPSITDGFDAMFVV